jgi:hypothetical protein
LRSFERRLKTGQALKDGVLQTRSGRDKTELLVEAQLLEVERVRKMYGEWTSICKI